MRTVVTLVLNGGRERKTFYVYICKFASIKKWGGGINEWNLFKYLIIVYKEKNAMYQTFVIFIVEKN